MVDNRVGVRRLRRRGRCVLPRRLRGGANNRPRGRRGVQATPADGTDGTPTSGGGGRGGARDRRRGGGDAAAGGGQEAHDGVGG